MYGTPRLLKVDAETLKELNHAHDELIDYLKWVEQRDVAAAERLTRIVSRMGNLIIAVFEGNYPEVTRVVDAIYKLQDGIAAKLAAGVSEKAIEQMVKQGDELLRQMIKHVEQLAHKKPVSH